MDSKKELTRIYKDNYWHWRCYIAKHIRIRADTEDILHDVYMTVLQHGNDYLCRITNLKGFLFTSLKNKLIDYHRKRGTYQRAIKENSLGCEWQLPLKIMPKNSIYNQDLKLHLYRALNELLTKERQELLQKTYIDGYTYKDISETSGININTLLTWNAKTVKMLRENPDMRRLYSDLYSKTIL